MSSIADRIKTAQDKNGMLRRALERIIQLYTDRSHFVYELLQNAEDAEATCVKFVQYPDRLEVFHDGRPFTTENLQGLCDIGKSDKVDNLNQIGEFGVGFKSVFGICDTVKLYSDPAHFRKGMVNDAAKFAVEILDFTSPVDIAFEELESIYTTKFVFPFTVGRTFSGFKTLSELNRVLSSKLQNLGITTLLFMKNLELIEYQINCGSVPMEGQYLLDKTVINDHCSLVSALGLSEAGKTHKEKTEEISYLKFSRIVDKSSTRTVDIAFPIIVRDNGDYECLKQSDPYISVYFPTETESKLGFIVQGPYRTTPNRSSIPADDEDNIRLAHETAELLRDTLIEMRNTGKLNMSFVKVLPLSAKNFDTYSLFAPLYDTVRTLFSKINIIPSKCGIFVSAQNAKIARQERLASLLSDDKLTSLIHDGREYRWLPTYLTETNKEYEAVYKYLTGELKIEVIRPEDLRSHFMNNPNFLPGQSEDWLVELYSILENVGAAFSKAKHENNLLTANIIKTSTGRFVAAYRKTESRQYIPNVFLPSDRITTNDINFVDPRIYSRCRHFFDNILQLQKPNEYEFFVKDVRRRYSGQYIFDEDKHIEDLHRLNKYVKNEDYKDEIQRIINELFVLRCRDGRVHNAYIERIFLPVSGTGLQIEGYMQNIAQSVFFVDMDFYDAHGVSVEMLTAMGVRESLMLYETVTGGQYYTGKPGKQPDWWTTGDFRWEITIEYLKEALKYISLHPNAKDSIIKSKTIFTILRDYESRLIGNVFIGGSTPSKFDEPCEMLHVVRGDRTRDWNGKWLYTESFELVSPKQISKHDLNTSIYGKPKQESKLYEMLGFRKTESDEVDDLKRIIPQNQLDAYFENELRLRFGITSADLSERFSGLTDSSRLQPDEDECLYPFPSARVKNWESLKKHAAEMLCYADPVKYEFAVRKIRVSNKPKEARAYLMNMYRYDGLYKYACQLCHDSCANIEIAQIFNNPETELDPMNVCLCPNCATIYRQLRTNTHIMEQFLNRILSLRESEVTNGDHVVIEIDNKELWFTQIHIAEVQALLLLTKEVKKKGETLVVSTSVEDDAEDGLSVYAGYVGKKLKRKDGFMGEIINFDGTYLIVKIMTGPQKGKGISISPEYLVKDPPIYQVIP